MLGLLFDGHSIKVIIKLNHAKTLRVVHVVTEYGCAALSLCFFDRAAQVATKTVPIKDIIAQYQRTRVACNRLIDEAKSAFREVWMKL